MARQAVIVDSRQISFSPTGWRAKEIFWNDNYLSADAKFSGMTKGGKVNKP